MLFNVRDLYNLISAIMTAMKIYNKEEVIFKLFLKKKGKNIYCRSQQAKMKIMKKKILVKSEFDVTMVSLLIIHSFFC